MKNLKDLQNYNFEEDRAQLGVGAGLYVKNKSGLFELAFPSEKVPSCSGDTETVEIDVTTSKRKTKLEGKETLNDVELEVFAHRDNKRRVEELSKEPHEYFSCDSDYSGEIFSGTMSNKVGDRASGDPTKMTVKIVPSALIEKNVEDGYTMIQDSARVLTQLPSVIHFSTMTETYENALSIFPSDATVEVKSETSAVATATCNGNKLVITGVAKGTAIIELTPKKDKFASWKRTIYVIVPETTI